MFGGYVGVRTEFCNAHYQAMGTLVNKSTASDGESNKTFLLHGTKPEVVYNILVQGLNPPDSTDMAR